MIGLFAKPAVAGLLLIATGPSLPELDIHRTCRETAGGDGLQHCVAEELYAKRKLQKYWNRTPLAYKKQCLLDPLPPQPSYMVLRDCINNNVMVHKNR